MDDFNRHAIRISVAQICQLIGWTSIQSSPLEILTDILQEYISGLGKIASNYATLYGQSEPNINHVALAFKDMGISLTELEEYVTHVDVSPALAVPKYPIQKESHLNHLKPGSREVVTRPVHIHEHLPPMHPHLEEQDYQISKSPLTVEISTSDSLSPLSSPKSIFKKPGDPVLNETRRGRQILEDEVRPLREISSVMMTTSGFLSPAREGKLPEARTQPIDFNRRSLPHDGTISVDQQPDNKTDKKKKIKSVDIAKKNDKENKAKEDQLCEQKESEDEAKGKKLVNTKETSKLKALKTGASKVPQTPPSPSPPKKVKVQLSPTANQSNLTFKQNKIKSPKNDKRPISPSVKDVVIMPPIELEVDMKLPSEPDKQKLNIFKKISKIKDEIEDIKPVNLEFPVGAIAPTESSNFFLTQKIKVEENIEINEEFDMRIDVENTSPRDDYEYCPAAIKIENDTDLPKLVEPKKKKKDKHREKKDPLEIDGYHHYNVPNNKYQIEDNLWKTDVSPVTEMPLQEEDCPSSFQLFPLTVPSNPSLLPSWNQSQYTPIITQNLTITPIPPVNHHTSVPNGVPITNQELPTPNEQTTTFHYSSSNNTNPASPSTAPVTPNKENHLAMMKKKDRKKDKKLKDKIKKKKDKKDKNKGKEKSERKKLKLEKKEKAKLKLKKDKKGKKKLKSDLLNRTFEAGHIDEDVLNTLQPWAADGFPHKKVKVEEKEERSSPVPKITFRLGPASPMDSPDTPVPRKIVIKPVVKKDEDNLIGNGPTIPDHLKQTNTLKIKTPKTGKFNLQNRIDVLEKPPSFTFSMFPHVALSKPETTPVIPKWEADPNKIWICPACGRPDDGSPMIACDKCDLWFHWTCVGIKENIDSDWYCSTCTAKRSEGPSEKKKKHRKKKP